MAANSRQGGQSDILLAVIITKKIIFPNQSNHSVDIWSNVWVCWYKKLTYCLQILKEERYTEEKNKASIWDYSRSCGLFWVHFYPGREANILSEKYELLDLEMVIDPYNLTLNTMSAAENRSRAEKVLQQLGRVADIKQDHFIFLAGEKYRKNLLPHLTSYEIPIEGLTIGRQLQALSR